MKAFVTGGAGFIGSNLVDRLLERADEVVAYDNLSTGRREFLKDALANPRFSLVEGDVLDGAAMAVAMRGADFVFHLAANADVRFGTEHPEKDLQQNTIATFRVLRPCAKTASNASPSARRARSMAADRVPDARGRTLPVQTSLYGASKLACEASSAPTARASAFRAGSSGSSRSSASATRTATCSTSRGACGRPQDAASSAMASSASRTSVHDCIDAIFLATRATAPPTRDDDPQPRRRRYCTVKDSIGWITSALGLARARLRGRRPRLDWRQSVHLLTAGACGVSAGRPSSRSSRASAHVSTCARRLALPGALATARRVIASGSPRAGRAESHHAGGAGRGAPVVAAANLPLGTVSAGAGAPRQRDRDRSHQRGHVAPARKPGGR